MKPSLLALGLLMIACGAESDFGEEDLELESADFPVYIPFKFGVQSDSEGMKCDATTSAGFGVSGKCNIPASRTLKISFVESNCSDWWITRWGNVLNGMQTLYNSYGWNVQFVSPAEANFHVGCDPFGPQGYFHPSNKTCTSNGFGQVCRYAKGTAGINTLMIENLPIWANANSTQRRKFANNNIRHEIEGHLAGHGHYNGPLGGAVLMAEGFPKDLSSPVWNTDLSLDATELTAIDCFNATANNPNSLCP